MAKKSNSPPRRMAGLGFEMAAGVGGFALFGYWLGGYYEHATLGLVIGAVLGIIGGMYNLIRASMRGSSNSGSQVTRKEPIPPDPESTE